jgi:hypothetical protein
MAAATRVAVMAALRKSGKGVFSHKKLDILPAYPLLSTHFALCPILFLCSVCLLAATTTQLRPPDNQDATSQPPPSYALSAVLRRNHSFLSSLFSISLIDKYSASSFLLIFISSFSDLFCFFLYLILYFLCLNFLSVFLIVY